jgi:hypothetical protein
MGRTAHFSTLPPIRRDDTIEEHADVAQLVEQLIRNQQVVSSSLTVGSSIMIPRLRSGFRLRARRFVLLNVTRA